MLQLIQLRTVDIGVQRRSFGAYFFLNPLDKWRSKFKTAVIGSALSFFVYSFVHRDRLLLKAFMVFVLQAFNLSLLLLPDFVNGKRELSFHKSVLKLGFHHNLLPLRTQLVRIENLPVGNLHP